MGMELATYPAQLIDFKLSQSKWNQRAIQSSSIIDREGTAYQYQDQKRRRNSNSSNQANLRMNMNVDEDDRLIFCPIVLHLVRR